MILDDATGVTVTCEGTFASEGEIKGLGKMLVIEMITVCMRCYNPTLDTNGL